MQDETDRALLNEENNAPTFIDIKKNKRPKEKLDESITLEPMASQGNKSAQNELKKKKP